MKNTRNFTRKLPKDRHEKPSDLAPVEPPHAGLSYNPSLKDHQDLLWKAAVIEMNKERADRKIEYHTTRMFPDRKDAPTAKSWVKEMSEGIPELDENAAQPDEEEPQGNIPIIILFRKSNSFYLFLQRKVMMKRKKPKVSSPKLKFNGTVRSVKSTHKMCKKPNWRKRKKAKICSG